jgi:hypothetical protein
LKIALVHDWLTGMRGGEKVLLELVRFFPAADVFTLLWKRDSVSPEIEARVRQTSFLDRLPGAARTYRYYLPLFPRAIRSLDLAGYDLVVSSSHAVAKGVRVAAGAVHVSYIHTPMRYLWESSDDYFQFGRGRWWKRSALGMVAPRRPPERGRRAFLPRQLGECARAHRPHLRSGCKGHLPPGGH